MTSSSTWKRLGARARLVPALGAVAAVLALGVGLDLGAPAVSAALLVPPPALDEPAGAGDEVAVLAGGCFWGVQGVFQHVKGVKSAVSGYDGGAAATAHYDLTTHGDTGHAEAVEITFDPHQISFGRLLQIYFSVAHDPTELNQQGPDRGPQYRSAIFPQSEAQARVARGYIAELDAAHAFGAPIATTIEPGKTFYRAEDYHQDYLTRNPTSNYIAYVDMPKIENLKRLFPQVYRAQPVLVLAGG